MRGFSLCSQTAATAKLHNESNLLAQKLHFGIAEQILDESLKLLPQLGTGGRLNFRLLTYRTMISSRKDSSSGSDSPAINYSRVDRRLLLRVQ